MNASFKYLLGAMVSLAAASAYAIPTLQLNITGGTYDNATQTVILDTGATSFTVNAYLQEDASNPITDWYGLSIALVPKTGPAASTLGSFKIDSTTVKVTADMVYGVPPLEDVLSLQGQDPGDLAKHGIFETFFYEYAFQFVTGQTTSSVNTENTPEFDPTRDTGSALYYVQFALDAALLKQTDANLISLHFDLYNTKLIESCKNKNCTVGDIDISQFAPFSHDAEWRPGDGGGPIPNPAPAPLALIGLGAFLLGCSRRWLGR